MGRMPRVRTCYIILVGFTLVTFFVLTWDPLSKKPGYFDALSEVDEVLPTIYNLIHDERWLKDQENTRYTPFLKEDTYGLAFDLVGAIVFDGTISSVTVAVKTGLIHNFHPDLERSAQRRMLDPSDRQLFWCSRSPALQWHGDHVILLARITKCHQQTKLSKSDPNQFRRDYFYTQTYDGALRPITAGGFVGMVLPKYESWMGRYLDGPQDPRPISFRGKPYFVFHVAYVSSEGIRSISPALWDYLENEPIVLSIKSAIVPKKTLNIEKNWMPLVANDELYFIKNIDPLEVIKCNINGTCDFVVKQKGAAFNQKANYIRGGTNFVLHTWPYYIGVAHSVRYIHDSARNYYTNLVIVRVTDFSLVYVSGDIKLNSSIYAGFPQPEPFIPDPFFFPVTCILEGQDTVALGGHINDRTGVIIRLTGIQSIVDTVKQSVRDRLNRISAPGTIHSTVKKLIWTPGV